MSDTKQKPKRKEKIIVSQDEQGFIQGHDKDGNLLWKQEISVAQQAKLNIGIKPVRSDRKVKYIYVLNEDQEKVLVPVGFNLEDLPSRRMDGTALKAVKQEYNEVLGANICVMITEGFTIKEICDMDGMPSKHVVFNWFVHHPQFKLAYEEAEKRRAKYYHDRIHDIAHTVTEETAKSDRVALDGFKYLASVNDPDKYGPRTKVVGDPNAPVGFIIDTGIRRTPEQVSEAPDQEAIPAEGKVVDAED